jgi:transcriptional regulator with XRE-family HTH domain
MNAEIFWSRITRLIREKGFSENGFARRCGINTATFKGWKFKGIIPNLIDVAYMANLLEVSIDSMVEGTLAAD